MKRPYIFSLGAAFILLIFALIVLTFGTLDPYSFQYDDTEMLAKTLPESHLLSPQKMIDWQKEEELELIDLRSPASFDVYALEKAQNIPAERILDKSLNVFFATDQKKILIDEDGLRANQIWMLLTKFGYKNLYVLEGGVQNWRDHVAVTTLQKSTAYEDEKPRFDYATVMKE